MDADELRRRVKAARTLGGFKSTDELAEALGPDSKLGSRTLRTLESDKAPRAFRRYELQLIAEACRLPYEFFTADFAKLADGNVIDDRIEKLEHRLETVVAEIREEAIQAAREDLRRAGERAEQSAGRLPHRSHEVERKPA